MIYQLHFDASVSVASLTLKVFLYSITNSTPKYNCDYNWDKQSHYTTSVRIASSSFSEQNIFILREVIPGRIKIQVMKV